MALTFQELILNLSKYWSDNGCVIQQPYDIEKGASTMNPATFLRALAHSCICSSDLPDAADLRQGTA